MSTGNEQKNDPVNVSGVENLDDAMPFVLDNGRPPKSKKPRLDFSKEDDTPEKRVAYHAEGAISQVTQAAQEDSRASMMAKIKAVREKRGPQTR